MGHLVRKGDIHPTELLACAKREAELQNPALNAIVHIADNPMIADISHGAAFSGVPFLAKDINVHVRGMPLRHACRFFENVPHSDHDSLLVSRWREAGLTVFGRTNTPEFATDFGCEPEFYGPTCNPWQLDLTPGGSSGGAAASVAAGILPMAHASDSGGSIRVPAACCGVFGFKPSSGLVATGSDLGSLVNGLNSDHVISWTVRDSAAMLDATSGRDPGAPHHYTRPDGAFLNQFDDPLEALRIGLVNASPTGFEPDQETRDCMDQAARHLQDMGHHVSNWHWPDHVDACDLAARFWINELTATIDQQATKLGRAPHPEELGPVIHWAMNEARNTNSVELVQATTQVVRLRRSMMEAIKNIDVILCPVVTGPPLQSGALTKSVQDGLEHWFDMAWRFAPYTEIFNMTGQPAMSVPLFQSHAGLPIGVHFAARFGDDLRLLKLARQLEISLPWAHRRPPDRA